MQRSYKVGTRFVFTRDMTPKLTIWLSIPPGKQEPSPYLRPCPISIWQSSRDAWCRRKSIWVQQASYPGLMLNGVPWRVNEAVWIYVTLVSPNAAWFDYFLVEQSQRASTNICWQFQESAYGLQILLGMVWLQSCLSGDLQQLEASIQQSRTSYLAHRCSWLSRPITVASIRHASSASAINSPCSAVNFWRLCTSPSQVHHHSACRAQYLLPDLPCRPHPAHRQMLQDRSDYLQ